MSNFTQTEILACMVTKMKKTQLITLTNLGLVPLVEKSVRNFQRPIEIYLISGINHLPRSIV